MKFVSYNIQYGLGRDGRFDIGRVAETVRGADVIALQEVERFWKRSGMVDQPREIADRLDGYYWVYGADLDMDCSFSDGNGKAVNRRRQHGNMILSKTPILSSRNFPLPKYGTLTQHSIQQGALEAVVDNPAGAVRVYSTHLSHLLAEFRLDQVEAVLDIHRRAYGEGGAWSGGHPDPDAGWTEGETPPMPREAILMGDFNFEPGDAEYEAIVGPKVQRYGRLNHRDGFIDAWVAAGHDEASGVTSPAKPGEPVSENNRLDYCFVSSALAGRVASARIDTEAVASDHQPIWVEIDLESAPADALAEGMHR